jgi:hypothetical protein
LFFLDFKLWGLQAAGYHTTNILIHFFSTLLVMWLMKLLSENLVASFWAGVLFAVHPVHVEPVAWISGRFDGLCVFWYLAALVFYVQARKKEGQQTVLFYAASLVSCVGAFLSKEMSATLPLIILLISIFYDISPSPASTRRLLSWWLRIKSVVPYFVLLGIYIAWRTYALGGIGGYNPGQGTGQFGLSAELIASFIHKLNRLTIPIFSFHAYQPLVFLGLFLLLTVIMSRHFQFGVIWIFVTLLPVLTLYLEGDIHHTLAERYLYLPSVGLSFFVVGLFESLKKSINKHLVVKRLAVWILLGGVSLYYVQSTRDEVSLWRTASDIARTIPREVKALYPDVSEAVFYFEDLPDNLHGAYIYRLGADEAMKIAYRDSSTGTSPRVGIRQTRNCLDLGSGRFAEKSAYCFRYEDGHVKDMTQETLILLDPQSGRLNPEDYQVSDVINFRRPEVDRFLLDGWSFRENWGRWAIDTTARIAFSLPEHQAYEMTVKIRSLPSEDKQQIVHLKINDVLIQEIVLTEPHWQTLTVTVPETAFNGHIELLQFESEYIASPASQGLGDDRRRLAFGIEFLSFRPIL